MGYLDFILSQKLLLSHPKKIDILIIDDNGRQYLEPFFGRCSHDTITFKNGKIYGFGLLHASIQKILALNSFVGGYIDWIISRTKPKLVISRLENLPAIYFLKTRHEEVKFIVIQNGMAGINFDRKNCVYPRVDYMYTFGEVFTKYFASKVQAEFVELGSLKNNDSKPVLNLRKMAKVRTLSFISQYVRSNESGAIKAKNHKHMELRASMAKEASLLKNIEDWCYKNGFRFQVIGRQSLADYEKIYYRGILRKDFSYIDNDADGKAYQILDMSDIVCTIDSALGYEALSRGCKTAFFSIHSTPATGDMRSFGGPAGWSPEGAFWTRKHDNDTVYQILNYLYRLSESEWRTSIEDVRYKVVGRDNSEKLRNCVRQILTGF